MAGKAEKRGDSVDIVKMMDAQTQQNYGLLRSQDNGAPKQRNYSIGTANLDPESRLKLDVRGGVMLGALGFQGIATAELDASGIIDMADYNSPRLYITNTALNTLKVIIPVIKDGQEVWIRSNAGVATPIQNTSGTGDEVTGNIETMAGTTYTMTGDDWICFHYDQTDSKFHQVTAGKQNIGGGGGGSVTDPLSNDLDAGQFSVTNLDDLDFTITTTNDAHINANQASGIMQFVIDVPTYSFEWWLGSNTLFKLDQSNFNIRYPNSAFNFEIFSSTTTEEYEFQNGFADWHNNVLRNCSGISLTGTTGIDFNAGSGNVIQQDSGGDMLYSLASTFNKHQFFVGSERLSIDDSHIYAYNPLFVSTITASTSNLNDAIILTAGTGFIFTSSVSFQWLIGANFSEMTATDLNLDVNLLPVITNAYDIGSTSKAWNDIYLDDSVIGRESYAAGTAPTAISGWYQIFARDDGAGKTQLRVKFQTGISVLIATEP